MGLTLACCPCTCGMANKILSLYLATYIYSSSRPYYVFFCMEIFDCKQVRGLDNKILTLKTVPTSLKQKTKWPIWITQRPHLTKSGLPLIQSQTTVVTLYQPITR